MKKFSLSSVNEPLSRNEMRAISAGKAQNYIQIRCTNGTTAGSSNTTMAEANNYAASLCNGGTFSIVCVGEC